MRKTEITHERVHAIESFFSGTSSRSISAVSEAEAAPKILRLMKIRGLDFERGCRIYGVPFDCAAPCVRSAQRGRIFHLLPPLRFAPRLERGGFAGSTASLRMDLMSHPLPFLGLLLAFLPCVLALDSNSNTKSPPFFQPPAAGSRSSAAWVAPPPLLLQAGGGRRSGSWGMTACNGAGGAAGNQASG